MSFKTTILLSPVLGLLLAFSSCSKVNETIQRDVVITPSSIEFTIPIITTTVSGTTFGKFNSDDLNLDALIKEQASRFGAENIKSIKLKEFRIELMNITNEDGEIDDDNNISNLEDVSVSILAAGQATTIVANTLPYDSEASGLIIPVIENIELKNFVDTSSFSYSITGKARRQTTKELNAKATLTYTITVGL